MSQHNYKTIFIGIIIAYFFAQTIIAFVAKDIDNIRYFSIFQLVFFVAPILFFLKEKQQNTVNIQNDFSLLETENIKQNFWQTVKNYLKINLNFKPEIFIYLLWGFVGLSLLNIGTLTIIEFLIPNSLLENYNSMMKNAIQAQIILTTNHSKTFFEILQITFFIALIPAICEEILFRGYLQQNILEQNSPTFALISTALIFSIIHFNIGGFLPIFFIGLYLGMLFYTTKSIIPAMFLHFLNNFFIIVSVNFGDTNSEQKIPFLIGLFLFTVGGILVFFTYSKIKFLSSSTSLK